MVRPKNPEGTVKNHFVVIRYSPIEYEVIKNNYAKTQYPSLASFLRTITLGKKIIVTSLGKKSVCNTDDRIKKIDEIKTEIARIGNNVNQIAKLCNSKKYTGKAELNAILVELHKIHDILQTFYQL